MQRGQMLEIGHVRLPIEIHLKGPSTAGGSRRESFYTKGLHRAVNVSLLNYYRAPSTGCG